MTPMTLEQLIAADRVQPLKAAIAARLAALLPGVKVIAHPGKIDIGEVVAKSVVDAPGIAIGWSRIRPVRALDGRYHQMVDFTAYVVVEDKAIANRRVEREVIGYAIGSQILKILHSTEALGWGLAGITPPDQVELKPFFTIRDAAQGAAYYVVTWSQGVILAGDDLWADLPLPVSVSEAGPEFAGPAEIDAVLASLGYPALDDEEAP